MRGGGGASCKGEGNLRPPPPQLRLAWSFFLPSSSFQTLPFEDKGKKLLSCFGPTQGWAECGF